MSLATRQDDHDHERQHGFRQSVKSASVTDLTLSRPPSSSPTDNSACLSQTSLEKAPTARDHDEKNKQVSNDRTTTNTSVAGPRHSIFTANQKRFIVFMASWAGFFSPVSASIYLPALNVLARDLNVSDTLINLTLTSYMIFQGLAPAFIGSLADSTGRRPAYTVCFVLYIAANIGLALQDSYAALFVLRCLQSAGSSATIAMASGVVSDVATPSERGAYMGFTFAGSLLGPAIGPVIGGILSEFLGWRAIFWFLVIFSGVFLLVFLVFFPETARRIVGNGSIPPPKGLNMSLMNYLAVRKARKEDDQQRQKGTKGVTELKGDDSTATLPEKKRFHFPNPLASLIIILDKENALLLFYNAFLFAAFYDITAVIPSQFAEIYGFNDLQIGLCYLPFGFGSMLAALVNGQFLDRNFVRWCRKLGVRVKKGRDQDLRNFPIEKARLQVAIPASYFASAMVLVFGWVLNFEGPLAAMLVLLFLCAFSMSVAFNVTSTLLVDFYPKSPATATAANNLVRCWLGAAATGVVIPMINTMGRGWAFTFWALFLIATSPMLWLNYVFGMKWREQRRIKDETKQQSKENKRLGKIEEGVNTDAEKNATRDGPPTSLPDEISDGLPELTAAANENRKF